MHYCRNIHGCRVHDYGHEGNCTCREYWVNKDDGHELLDGVESTKAWREDHDPCECAIHGGDCIGISSSIEAHYRAERDWWRDAVDKAIRNGWLGDEKCPYWSVSWETENRYCKEEIQRRKGSF
jgi:hypothetical protein